MEKSLILPWKSPTMVERTGGLSEFSLACDERWVSRQCIHIHVNTRSAGFCLYASLVALRSQLHGRAVALWRYTEQQRAFTGSPHGRHAATTSANRFPTTGGLTMRNHPILYRAYPS